MVTFDRSIDFPIESRTIEEVAAEYDLDIGEIRDDLWIAGGEETYASSLSGIGEFLEKNPDYVCLAPGGTHINDSWIAWIGDSYGTLEEGGTKKDQHRDAVRVTFNRQAEKLGISYETNAVLLWTQPMRSLEHFGLDWDEARAYLRFDAGESFSDIADELEINPEEAQNLIDNAESKMNEARQTLEDLDKKVLRATIALRPPMGTSGEDVARKFSEDLDDLIDVYRKAIQDKSQTEDPTSALILFTKGGKSYSEVYEMASRSSAD